MVLLKCPQNIENSSQLYLQKQPINFEQTHTVTIFGEHGIMPHTLHTMRAKPIRALELHYPIIQFLMIVHVG